MFSTRDPLAPLVDLGWPSQARATKIHAWCQWITHGKTFHYSVNWFHSGNAFTVEKRNISIQFSISTKLQCISISDHFPSSILDREFMGACQLEPLYCNGTIPGSFCPIFGGGSFILTSFWGGCKTKYTTAPQGMLITVAIFTLKIWPQCTIAHWPFC